MVSIFFHANSVFSLEIETDVTSSKSNNRDVFESGTARVIQKKVCGGKFRPLTPLQRILLNGLYPMLMKEGTN